MYSNEVRLKILISQIDNHLAKSIIDMFTSRYEVGTIHETTCYVRFAYFMGEQVENAAQMICRTSIDTHRFHAEVSYEGRKKFFGKDQKVNQWNATINGHNLPELPDEEL